MEKDFGDYLNIDANETDFKPISDGLYLAKIKHINKRRLPCYEDKFELILTWEVLEGDCGGR